MSLPPIEQKKEESYSSLIQVKKKEPSTTKNAAVSIKPKQHKFVTKIDTLDLNNRKSSAGSVATPKKRPKN
jgi:hypothetical protein